MGGCRSIGSNWLHPVARANASRLHASARVDAPRRDAQVRSCYPTVHNVVASLSFLTRSEPGGTETQLCPLGHTLLHLDRVLVLDSSVLDPSVERSRHICARISLKKRLNRRTAMRAFVE